MMTISASVIATEDREQLEPATPIASPQRDKTGIPLRNVLFEPTEPRSLSASLTDAQKQLVRDLMLTVSTQPNLATVVIGHTDDRECRNEVACKALGLRRATLVVNYLKSLEIAQQIGMPQSFGRDMPINSNGTDDGRAHNRAVNIGFVYVPEPVIMEHATKPSHD